MELIVSHNCHELYISMYLNNVPGERSKSAIKHLFPHQIKSDYISVSQGLHLTVQSFKKHKQLA